MAGDVLASPHVKITLGLDRGSNILGSQVESVSLDSTLFLGCEDAIFFEKKDFGGDLDLFVTVDR